MSSNDVDYFCGNRFLAHFWAILEPRYGHLKAFLGPKMTKTRSKQPKITPNHPKNGQKWCRNIFEKIDFWSFWGHFGVILGSFWGHFGVFWGLLGSFGVFWVFWGYVEPQKAQPLIKKAQNDPQNDLMAPKMAPYTPLWVPKNVLKTSLEAKITAENAFSDPGAHTNVVRNALLLPLVLVWSRLVDIDFWPQNRIFSHFAHYGKKQRHFHSGARQEAKNIDFFKILF